MPSAEFVPMHIRFPGSVYAWKPSLRLLVNRCPGSHTGAYFTKFFLSYFKFEGFFFYCNSIVKWYIAIYYCTCHDSIVVVSCATFHSNPFITTWVIAGWTFHRFDIAIWWAGIFLLISCFYPCFMHCSNCQYYGKFNLNTYIFFSEILVVTRCYIHGHEGAWLNFRIHGRCKYINTFITTVMQEITAYTTLIISICIYRHTCIECMVKPYVNQLVMHN